MTANTKPCGACNATGTLSDPNGVSKAKYKCGPCNGKGTVPLGKSEPLNRQVADLVQKRGLKQPSQPDPAGQTFENFAYAVIHAFIAGDRPYKTLEGTVNGLKDRYEADREAYARQEVVKALDELGALLIVNGRITIENIDNAIKAYKDGSR